MSSSTLSRVSDNQTSFCISNIGIISRPKCLPAPLYMLSVVETHTGQRSHQVVSDSKGSTIPTRKILCLNLIMKFFLHLNSWKDVYTKKGLPALSWSTGPFASQHLSSSKGLLALSGVLRTCRAKSPPSGVMWGTWKKLMTKFWQDFTTSETSGWETDETNHPKIWET